MCVCVCVCTSTNVNICCEISLQDCAISPHPHLSFCTTFTLIPHSTPHSPSPSLCTHFSSCLPAHPSLSPQAFFNPPFQPHSHTHPHPHPHSHPHSITLTQSLSPSLSPSSSFSPSLSPSLPLSPSLSPSLPLSPSLSPSPSSPSSPSLPHPQDRTGAKQPNVLIRLSLWFIRCTVARVIIAVCGLLYVMLVPVIMFVSLWVGVAL